MDQSYILKIQWIVTCITVNNDPYWLIWHHTIYRISVAYGTTCFQYLQYTRALMFVI
jgi:hypothetical protein